MRQKILLLAYSGTPYSLPTVKPPIAHQPSHGPRFQDRNEYQYFEVLRDDTAPELPGYFETDVWNHFVLQVCHEAAFAREAVIAIGVLTITAYIRADSPETLGYLSKSVKEHCNYVLQHYGQALRLMQDMNSQKHSNRFWNTIVSSLLTTCFESFIGNQEGAIAQAKLGVDILTEHQELASGGCRGGKNGPDRVSTFARLSAQRLVTIAEVSGAIAPTNSSRGLYYAKDYPPLPPVFSSTKDARYEWDLITEASLLSCGASNTEGIERIPSKETGRAWMTWYVTWYTNVAQMWHHAFEPVYERERARARLKGLPWCHYSDDKVAFGPRCSFGRLRACIRRRLSE